MWKRIQNEPVLVVGLVRNLLLLAAAFGLGITDTQTALILAAISSGLDLIARGQVSPV